jgi:1-acyl-sn-glycerol-3-phosphate acyltransferase
VQVQQTVWFLLNCEIVAWHLPGEEAMITPRLNRLGRALPLAWQQAIVRRSRGLDLRAIASDLFLDYPPDDRGFDPVGTKRRFFMIERLAGRYFRATTMGAENIPAGRVVIVARHSGVVPWDAMLLVAEIYRLTGRFSWNAGHEYWGRFASLKDLLVPTGMVLGGRAEFEELLRADQICTIFADGGQGNRHAYYLESDRYKVKPEKGFAPGCGGYIKVALRTRSPVVPVAIVGTEEIHYCLGDIPQLAEYLGVPFFPLIGSLIPLPARVYVRFGEAIQLAAPAEAADDQAVVDRLNEQVRSALQALIDDTLRRRKGIYWSSYDTSDGAQLRRKTAPQQAIARPTSAVPETRERAAAA